MNRNSSERKCSTTPVLTAIAVLLTACFLLASTANAEECCGNESVAANSADSVNESQPANDTKVVDPVDVVDDSVPPFGEGDDELTRTIQQVVDGEVPTSESAAMFRTFILEELPSNLAHAYDTSTLWIEPIDAGSIGTCRSLKVGEQGFPNEFRLHKHDTFDYRDEYRSVKKIAYIDFCHPRIEEIYGDVRSCAIEASVAAVIAAIIAENPAAAKAVFYPVFYECLNRKIGRRAREVTVRFRMRTERGCWKNHCK